MLLWHFYWSVTENICSLLWSHLTERVNFMTQHKTARAQTKENEANKCGIISPNVYISALTGLPRHSKQPPPPPLLRLQVRIFELLHNSQTQISEVYVPGVNEPMCEFACVFQPGACLCCEWAFDSCYAGRQTGLCRDDGIKKPTIDSYWQPSSS